MERGKVTFEPLDPAIPEATYSWTQQLRELLHFLSYLMLIRMGRLPLATIRIITKKTFTSFYPESLSQ